MKHTTISIVFFCFFLSTILARRAQPKDYCMCPKVYSPVCGVDGVTYGNTCEAKCTNAELDYKGACKEVKPCVCPKNYDPVCGVDGKTYGNSCEAKCADVQVDGAGPCPEIKPKPKICACPRSWIPVCGSDGKTYGNSKCAACANAKVVHEGKCTEKKGCLCPLLYAPVCGKDGKTYSNECMASCEKIEIAFDGDCEQAKKPKKLSRIERIFKMVDANNDGAIVMKELKDYLKMNKMNRIPKFGRKSIPEPIKKSCVCNEIYSPVCGENLKTYSNECELECDDVGILHRGQCQQIE
eukprot:gene2398-2862_t